MNKRNIITLGLLLVVFVIIFLILFFTNNGNDEIKSEFSELTLVTDESTFFSVGNNIDMLCQYATNGPEKVDFILKDEVNINNYKGLSFKADEVYVISDVYLYKYYVKGSLYTNIIESGNEYVRDEYFVLNYDINNRTFNIEVITKSIYENASEDEYIFEEIESNDYNRFEYTNLNAKSRALLYFNDFIDKVYNSPDDAYDLLSSDTVNEKFDTIDEFMKFIKSHTNIQLKEYSVNGNEIGVKDNYNNEYVFNISYVLKYNVTIYETEE